MKFRSNSAIIRYLLAYPSPRATWRMIGEHYAPPFRAFVDGVLRDTRTAQPSPEAGARLSKKNSRCTRIGHGTFVRREYPLFDRVRRRSSVRELLHRP
jgi:hypothetical protein